MNTLPEEINFIKQQLGEKDLYIHDVIDLAFMILDSNLKCNTL